MKKLLPNTLEQIAGWFRAPTDDAHSEPQNLDKTKNNDRNKATAPPSVASVVAEIESSLTQLEKSGKVAVAGRVQVLRFDELREELGDKWHRYSERIEQLIETSISQHLGPNDFTWQVGEHARVLVFTSVTPNEAEIKCGLIRARVEEYFKGDARVVGKITVETAVAALDGTIKLEGITDLETLYSQLNLPGMAEVPGSAEDRDGKTNDVQAGDKDGTASALPYEILSDESTAQIDWQSMTSDMDAARGQFKTMEYVDRHLWDTTQQKIVNTFVAPQGFVSDSVVSSDILGNQEFEVLARALDEETISRIQNRQSDPQEASIWFQTHFWSLQNARFRQTMIENFVRVEEDDTVGRVLEIVDVPDSRQFKPIGNFLEMLPRSIGDIAVCFDLVSPQFKMFPMQQVAWAGFSMRGLEIDESEALNAIAEFSNLAGKYGVKSYAHNVPSLNMVMAAIGFGIRHLFASPAAASGNNPNGSFDIENLYN